MSHIKLNAENVMKRVESAAVKSGRTLSDITVIGVTKTQTLPDIEELYDFGIREFGENRVQELLQKYDALSVKPVWHLIGHLQRNKVKQVVGKVRLIQSVESVELAREIGKRSEEAGIVSDILVEINIGAEDSKFGITLESAPSFVNDIQSVKGIAVRGLMCIAPFVENPEDNRELFRKMRNVFVDIRDKNTDNVCMSILSMGMTNDYEVAIEEGSNMVRVGTGFFGKRA